MNLRKKKLKKNKFCNFLSLIFSFFFSFLNNKIFNLKVKQKKKLNEFFRQKNVVSKEKRKKTKKRKRMKKYSGVILIKLE